MYVCLVYYVFAHVYMWRIEINMRCVPYLVRQVFLLDLILINWLDWVGLPISTCANGCTDGHTVLEIGAYWVLEI